MKAIFLLLWLLLPFTIVPVIAAEPIVVVSDMIGDAPPNYDISRITFELRDTQLTIRYELAGHFQELVEYVLQFDTDLDGGLDKIIMFVDSPECELLGNEFRKTLHCQLSPDMHTSTIEGVSVDDFGGYDFGIRALVLDPQRSTDQVVDWAPDTGFGTVSFLTSVTQPDIAGTYVTVSFRQTPTPGTIAKMRQLFPMVETGVAMIAELFGEQPVQITLTFDKTLEPAGEAAIFTTGIFVKDYPGTVPDAELLYTIFHETAHVYSFQTGFVLGSVSEGFAYFGSLQPLRLLHPEYSEEREAEFLSELHKYEVAGSPFQEVDWKSNHPRDGWKSDYIMAGMLLAVAQSYGLGLFASDELDRLLLFAPTEVCANDLVDSLARASGQSSVVDLFERWNFPLEEDSDGDGLTDGQEIRNGTNMLSQDTDSDGLSDSREIQMGTDPRQSDTDSDAWRDGIDPSPRDPLVPNLPLGVSIIVLLLLALALLRRRNRSRAFGQLETKPVPSVTTVMPATKFCRKCGAKILRDSLFCEECGAKVT